MDRSTQDLSEVLEHREQPEQALAARCCGALRSGVLAVEKARSRVAARAAAGYEWRSLNILGSLSPLSGGRKSVTANSTFATQGNSLSSKNSAVLAESESLKSS